MKKLLIRIVVILMIALCAVSVVNFPNIANAAVQTEFTSSSKLSVRFKQSKEQLFLKDKTKVLTAYVNVAGGTGNLKSVTWKSSNTSVATVDKNGKVTAKKCGTTTITCSVVNRMNAKASATCKVVVYDGSISLSSSNVSLNALKNEAKQLECSIKYLDIKTKDISWSSSNAKIATVDKNGKVTAKGVGNVTITAKNKATGHTATCKVAVYEEKILGVKAKEQTKSNTCSGAASLAVMKYVGSSFKGTDVDLYKAMSKEHTVGDVVKQLNKYIKGSPYKYGTYPNKTKWTDAVIKSIKSGYPVIALVKFSNNDYFKYSTNGHYTVIRGYKKDANGSITLYIADSYKITKNKGTFSIPLDTMYKYNKNKYSSCYLILKK